LDPSSAFELLEAQTGHSQPPNGAGAVAVVAFVVLVVLVLLALEQAADPRQLLLACVVLVSVNVLAAIVWSARKAPRS